MFKLGSKILINIKNVNNFPYAVIKTPWNDETELLVLNVKTQELREDNNGSNLVFLIDVSGSMGSEDKLELVKGSLNLLVEELSEKDTISIVTYSE